MEEIRKANRGCPAAELVFYFSENFPVNFTQGTLLIAECLADYYRTGELTATEYAGKNYDPVDHHIKDFTVTKDDLKILLGKLRSISQSLKSSAYTDYDDLSDLGIDFADGEQLFLLDKLQRITERRRMCRSTFHI